MSNHNEYSYVNPNKLSLEWECFIISKSDMLLDGVPCELINSWMDKDIIQPFSIKDNEINFKTKDVWKALNTQNWYNAHSN
ncbi:Uncharacterised protein [Staphylococcus petrasii]|uniref:Uncharacterized protein n=1 Tax=Staphylococcus petrasii TaxID=1276936 RepID=A0A380G3F8_9STAP|nr:hypothetical protein [Staphylococcus petrasii]MCI2773585.1 hypothetical protein [Staphylococcus petrasii]PNZ30411.1 hypothetical protein CD137_05140 [Staphylococcus petrasii]PNZ79981.1 hypothetical protein CD127_11450 [Staphylococcus petrasii]TGA82237.1 hypothetical protein E2554_01435 [Staphylococcus petrasii]TGE10929.1 hypothetical protein E2557_11795 [Staphylococcus petrasii]